MRETPIMVRVLRSLRTTAVVGGMLFGSCVAAAQAGQTVAEQRIIESTNGASFVLLPGASTVQQNVTLPAALPLVGQTLSVAAISGPSVTLGWANAGGGTSGQALFTRLTANTADAGAWTSVGMVVSVAASKTYAVSGVLRLSMSANNADAKVRFDFPPGSGMDISYTAASDRTAGPFDFNDTGGNTETNLRCPNNGVVETWYVSGTLTVSTTAGNVNLQINKDGGAQTTIAAGSYLLFTPLN